MSDLRNQRRMAADILKCGENRVWIDPLHNDEVAEAVTRQDVRGLIKKGLIDTRQKAGVSRARAKHLKAQKDKGRRKGPGSRKGKAGAREPKKRKWIKTIRPIRRVLKRLRDEGHLSRSDYRHYYRQAKGGAFRSKAHMVSHLKMDGVLAEGVTVLDDDANIVPEEALGPEDRADGAQEE